MYATHRSTLQHTATHCRRCANTLSVYAKKALFVALESTDKRTAQEWSSRTLVGHEPWMYSKICYTKKALFVALESAEKRTAQEWSNRTLVGHEPWMCSRICFTKKALFVALESADERKHSGGPKEHNSLTCAGLFDWGTL